MTSLADIFQIPDELNNDVVRQIVPMIDDLMSKYGVGRPTVEVSIIISTALMMNWDGGDPAGALITLGEDMRQRQKAAEH